MIPFVLVGQGRCGSTLLLNSLSKHPYCKVEGEYFNNQWSDQLSSFQRAEFFYQHNKDFQSTGFKLCPNQGYEDSRESVWEYLTQKEIRVLHLTRKNEFHRILSYLVAEYTKTWAIEKTSNWEFPNEFRVDKPLEWWEDQFQYHIRQEQYLVDKFSRNPYLRISYEDNISQNIWDTLKLVQVYLGLDPIPLPIFNVKQGTRRPSEYVVNYLQLREYYRNSPYSHWFNEDSYERLVHAP